MKQRLLSLSLAAAFAASVAVADAGQRHGGSSSSSSGSSSSGSSSGGGSSSSSGGGSSSSSGGGSSHDSSPPSRGVAVPRHGGADSGGGSSRSGGSSAGRSGGSSDGGYSSGGGAVRRHPEGRSGSGPDSAVAGVPDYSRPRGDRPVHGYAVPRGSVRPAPRPGGDYNNFYYLSPYRWYYDPFAFGTFGLGYIYDPFWWGGGYGGYPYGYGGAYGGGYGYGYGYGGGGGGGQDDDRGALRIRVKPREAKVRVDGYFVGTVDDFDGNFQKLRLDDGPHKVELVLDGYNTLKFDVMIVEGQTVTYKGKMAER